MPSEKEYFEVFDEAGRPQGLVSRTEVHTRGLWHKSAHVFLFNHQKDLLIQRRSVTKDLYPGLWDYSVGEHLQPGETYLAGARRGLEEELGVRNVALELLHVSQKVEHHGQGFIDREMQQAFCCKYTGPFEIDPVEVAEVKFCTLTDLKWWVEQTPEDFTPWFVADLRRHDWLS